MPIDEAGNTADASSPRNEEEQRTQSFGEVFMEAVTAVGNSIRTSFVEANRCVRNCVYPAKQRCIKIYDNLTNSFTNNGSRSMISSSTASRFGNDCDLSE